MKARWIGGGLMLGWLGLTSSSGAQAPLPAGPNTPPAAKAPVPTDPVSLPIQPTPVSESSQIAQPPEEYPVEQGQEVYQGQPVYDSQSWCPPVLPPTPGPAPSVPCEGIAISDFAPEMDCKTGPCFTARLDYLLWWTKNRGMPLLATTGQINDPLPGAVGQPTTSELIGGALPGSDRRSAHDRAFDANNHQGYRIMLGAWLDHCETWSADASFFQLFERTASVSASSIDLNRPPPTVPIVLARPFINEVPGQNVALVIGAPGLTNGILQVGLERSVHGGEANLSCYTPYSAYSLGRWGLIGGFRYMALDTSMTITQRVEAAAGLPGQRPFTTLVEDLEGTTRFYGGQIGAVYGLCWGGWSLNLTGKFAVGSNNESVDFKATSVNVNGAGRITGGTVNNGVVVRPSNAGVTSQTKMSWIGEGSLTMSYDFNDWVRVNVAYTALYWKDVVEPEDQLDFVVNNATRQRPTVRLSEDDFWLQGVSFGVQFSF